MSSFSPPFMCSYTGSSNFSGSLLSFMLAYVSSLGSILEKLPLREEWVEWRCMSVMVTSGTDGVREMFPGSNVVEVLVSMS